MPPYLGQKRFQTHILFTDAASGQLIMDTGYRWVNAWAILLSSPFFSHHRYCSTPNGQGNWSKGEKRSWKSLRCPFSLSAGPRAGQLSVSARWNVACAVRCLLLSWPFWRNRCGEGERGCEFHIILAKGWEFTGKKVIHWTVWRTVVPNHRPITSDIPELTAIRRLSFLWWHIRLHGDRYFSTQLILLSAH